MPATPWAGTLLIFLPLLPTPFLLTSTQGPKFLLTKEKPWAKVQLVAVAFAKPYCIYKCSNAGLSKDFIPMLLVGGR